MDIINITFLKDSQVVYLPTTIYISKEILMIIIYLLTIIDIICLLQCDIFSSEKLFQKLHFQRRYQYVHCGCIIIAYNGYYIIKGNPYLQCYMSSYLLWSKTPTSKAGIQQISIRISLRHNHANVLPLFILYMVVCMVCFSGCAKESGKTPILHYYNEATIHMIDKYIQGVCKKNVLLNILIVCKQSTEAIPPYYISNESWHNTQHHLYIWCWLLYEIIKKTKKSVPRYNVPFFGFSIIITSCRSHTGIVFVPGVCR